jgi:predicted PurR-regulated permease PerM
MENNYIQNKSNYTLPQRIWVKGSIYAFILVILLFLKATFSVFLLIMAGALVSLFFHGFAMMICKKTKWKEGVCLTVSVLTTLVFLVGFFWLMGTKLQAQVEQLSRALPDTIDNARNKLNESALGKKIVENLSSPETMNKLKALAGTFFKTTFGIFGDIYIVLFIGIFFTVSPGIYKNGVVKLMPEEAKAKANDVLTKIGGNLQKWIKGKLFAMLVVFILTAIGLLIIKTPLWLVLALIAGILNFIPNFGPLIALIPAALIGLLQGPNTALTIAALYIVVQVLESNFITPMVQKKLISIPPAIIIIAQLLIAPFTGGWGLVLATPLTVIIFVLVQELYLVKEDNRSS